MHAVQQPLAWSALDEVMGVPGWKSHPSWFLVADGDQAIPPDAERQFAARMGATTVEVPTNHVAMVSHPDDVVQLIKTAAEAVQAGQRPCKPPGCVSRSLATATKDPGYWQALGARGPVSGGMLLEDAG